MFEVIEEKIAVPLILVITVLVLGGIFWSVNLADKDFEKASEYAPIVKSEKKDNEGTFVDCLAPHGNPVREEYEPLTRKPFYLYEDFGQKIGFVVVQGGIEVQEVNYFGENIDKVYLRLSNEENTTAIDFLKYFRDKVEQGNSINKVADEDLLFAIGQLSDGGDFITRAGLTQETKNLIERNINSGELIELRLRMDPLAGGGAPADFTFACAIESEFNNTANWQTYRNEEFGFEFKYPGGWEVQEDNDMIKVFSENLQELPEGGRHSFSVWITEQTITGFKEQYTEAGDSVIVSEEVVSIDTQAAVKITGVNAIGLEDVYIFAEEQSLFVGYPGYTEEIANQILSTFKFIE